MTARRDAAPQCRSVERASERASERRACAIVDELEVTRARVRARAVAVAVAVADRDVIHLFVIRPVSSSSSRWCRR